MAKRKTKSKKRRAPTKSRLAGFTRVKGKYALVFKKGGKLRVGKSRFGSKKTLMTKARKYLK